MHKFIDADKLVDQLKKRYDWLVGEYACNKWEEYTQGFLEALDMVESAANEAPTADAQEVVRCKNCKYNEGSFCVYTELKVNDEDFCSRGAKRDNDEERSVQK